MNVRFIICYLFLEALLIFGCQEPDCTFEQSVAEIGELFAENVVYQGYNNIDPLDQSDSVTASQYAIWLKVDPVYVAQNQSGSGWPGRAMACDPKEPLLLEKIDQMQIQTTTGFNGLSVGTDLTEHFVFMADNEPISVTSDLINAYLQQEFYLFLRCTLAVDFDQPAQFYLNITMDDGSVYKLTTQPIVLLKPLI